ncbi:hypothetical protein V6N11_017213 [Hibiscus sabdariffa]|uniref:Uncharacterized protein n=1 Tax=Hibiscus sabdariffa TaxID=183260 RepID=A0ABR2TXM6_9ROSI
MDVDLHCLTLRLSLASLLDYHHHSQAKSNHPPFERPIEVPASTIVHPSTLTTSTVIATSLHSFESPLVPPLNQTLSKPIRPPQQRPLPN